MLTLIYLLLSSLQFSYFGLVGWTTKSYSHLFIRLLNENRYFDNVSTDKWEWLGNFILFYSIFVCLFTHFKKFERSACCAHNKLATSMLVSSSDYACVSVCFSKNSVCIVCACNVFSTYVVRGLSAAYSHFISHHDTALLLWTAQRILSSFALTLWIYSRPSLRCDALHTIWTYFFLLVVHSVFSCVFFNSSLVSSILAQTICLASTFVDAKQTTLSRLFFLPFTSIYLVLRLPLFLY